MSTRQVQRQRQEPERIQKAERNINRSRSEGSKSLDRSPPSRPRGEERLEAIRRVVLELVADYGFDGVTIDAIATAAQASKQTLYRHWPTKLDLVRDAIKLSFGSANPGDSGDHGDLREELRLILQAAAIMLQTNRRLIIALIDGAQRDSTVMSIMRQETRDNYRESLQRPLKRAIARGEIGPETDLDLIAEVAFPMLLHRAMFDEIIDERMVNNILENVVLKLVSRPDFTK